MRRAQNADTHELKQHRLSQNIFPVCSSFVLVIASDMHLEPESEKRAKNVHFHTTKNIQIQSTLFHYFWTNSYKLTYDLFTVVWPQRQLLGKVLRQQFEDNQFSACEGIFRNTLRRFWLCLIGWFGLPCNADITSLREQPTDHGTLCCTPFLLHLAASIIPCRMWM